MLPEFGLFALILALGLTALQFSLPILGLIYNKKLWLESSGIFALGQSFFISLSFLSLVYAFAQDDFSVAYVAEHSNASLPYIYKLCAIWGGHEGSLLLWILFLSGWSVAVYFSGRRSENLPFYSVVLAVLGIISFGFLLLLLFASNPFLRLLPDYPLDGRDLNPLLQDPALIVHPPFLYLGYVGFAVPFAFALSALVANLNKEGVSLQWTKWLRPWVLAAFSFLTIGIMLGSWWAYYELGWGGWWFWDPVENASFMPWLLGIALIHSLMTTAKRHIFQNFTIILCILIFGFSLLGIFLTRSGLIVSVHSFASSPQWGLFLLSFILILMLAAFTLYAMQGKPFFKSQPISIYSREMLILITIICLWIATLAILLGTVFPILFEAFTHKKISVGVHYFNTVFIPVMLPVLLFIPLGPLSHWGDNNVKPLLKKQRWIILLSIFLAILIPTINNSINLLKFAGVFLGLSLSFWIILGTLKSAYLKMQKKDPWWRLSFGAWGMIFAHIGMGVMIIGITLVSAYQIENTLRLTPGQSMDVAGYHVLFDKVERSEGSNYIGYRGHFKITNNKTLIELFPETRIFVVQGLATSETAIDPGVFRDLYIALGEKLDNNAWSARIYYKPFVRWIWLGAILIAIGGILAAIGRRQAISS